MGSCIGTNNLGLAYRGRTSLTVGELLGRESLPGIKLDESVDDNNVLRTKCEKIECCLIV